MLLSKAANRDVLLQRRGQACVVSETVLLAGGGETVRMTRRIEAQLYDRPSFCTDHRGRGGLYRDRCHVAGPGTLSNCLVIGLLIHQLQLPRALTEDKQ